MGSGGGLRVAGLRSLAHGLTGASASRGEGTGCSIRLRRASDPDRANRVFPRNAVPPNTVPPNTAPLNLVPVNTAGPVL
jgi:hypothetical protein